MSHINRIQRLGRLCCHAILYLYHREMEEADDFKTWPNHQSTSMFSRYFSPMFRLQAARMSSIRRESRTNK